MKKPVKRSTSGRLLPKGRKNHAKSVKTRLLNLMNTSGYKYMYLLARYFNERLLYRVSVSQYKDNFLLKGGSLLYAFNGLETRPTIDIAISELHQLEIDEDNDINYAHDDDIICCNEEDLKSNCV